MCQYSLELVRFVKGDGEDDMVVRFGLPPHCRRATGSYRTGVNRPLDLVVCVPAALLEQRS